MKQKLVTVFCIILVVLIVNVLLNIKIYQNILPYYWGSKDISDKRTYLLKHQHQYNTIFLGSSKTHNQVVAELFNQTAQKNNLDIRSYNFGISGLTPPESFNIYNNLLSKDNLKLKYAFIELDWIATIKYENLNQARSFYWLNKDNYLSSINSIFNSSVPAGRKLWGYFHYSVDYFENILNIGRLQEYVKYKDELNTHKISGLDSDYLFKGYQPLHNTLTKAETTQFNEVISSAKIGFKHYNSLKTSKPSYPYLQLLQKIIAVSKMKGTQVYFIVPLQWKYYQYQEIIPIIHNIRGANVICLFDPEKYSSVYKPENFADPNHLNFRGAPLYTEELFKLFKFQNNN